MKKLSFLISIIMLLVFSVEAAAYTPRFEAPTNNAYYTTLNPYYHSGFGMTDGNIGNCTCYAYGRSYENLGSRPSLSHSDAHRWYAHNKSGAHYSYSSDVTKPALGAVAVWQKKGISSGHVAIVEKIDCDTVTTSESGWKQYYFKTLERNMSDPSLGQEGYDFLGYIYVCGEPRISEAPKAVKNLRSRDREYSLGETIDFRWNVSYGSDSYWAYIWHNGREIYGENLAKATDFSFAPQAEGEYRLIINAVNSYGFAGAEYDFSVSADADIWRNPYDDVMGNDWYYDAVKSVSSAKLMHGIDEDSFAPSEPISRAMLAVILHRTDGSPASGEAQYSDVPTGAYYSSALAWASELGIVKGMADGIFAPDEAVTREQLVTMLYRYMEYKNPASLGMEADISAYPDSALIDEYARTAFSYALANGIIQGDEDGFLMPDKAASRAEMAQIIAVGGLYPKLG